MRIHCVVTVFFCEFRLNVFRKLNVIISSWHYCKMASEKPGSVQQDETNNFDEIEASLLSMENIDRASPELWPEKYQGITEFMNSYSNPVSKLPYTKEFNAEDDHYIHQLATLSMSQMISRVKELHDIAYQLGVEESKEMTRGNYLNIFGATKKQRKEK